MDFLFSFSGLVCVLLIGGALGYGLHFLVCIPKIRALTDSIQERDTHLLAIAHDHKTIMADKEATYIALKADMTHLERKNTELKIHITDLRKTVLQLEEENQSALRMLHLATEDEIFPIPHNQNIQRSHPHDSLTLQVTQDPNGKSDDIAASMYAADPAATDTITRLHKHLKKAQRKNKKLRKRIEKLLLASSSHAIERTIIKEVPVVMREEILLKEAIDKKKLQEILNYHVPITSSIQKIKLSKEKSNARRDES